MRIYPPEIHTRERESILSARVEMEQAGGVQAFELWFALPERHQSSLSPDCDPFAAALLPVAMARGETLFVTGALSSRLLYGMQEYQKVFALWWPGELTGIDVRPEEITTRRDKPATPKVASTFSGGLDSGYTVWSHLPRNQSNPHYRLDYAFLVQGFDLPLDDSAGFQQCVDAYRRLLEPEGVELIPIRTNVFQVIQPLIRWTFSQGAVLNAIGLLFGPVLSKYLIPASGYHLTTKGYGTHPLVDHYLTIETMEVIHHGGELNRFDKFRALSDWDDFLSIIRVCFHDPKGMLNCGHCVKCTRAIAAMDLIGKLDGWKTMPGPKGRAQVRMVRAPTPTKAHDVYTMIAYAEKVGR